MKFSNCFVRLDIYKEEYDVNPHPYTTSYIYVDENGLPVSYEKNNCRLTIFYNGGSINKDVVIDKDEMEKMVSSGYIAHSLIKPAIWDKDYYILGERFDESSWLYNKLSMKFKMGEFIK